MDQWLVRTSENVIAGPYTDGQLRQLIREGKLHLHDEICKANGYWLHLHEHDEILRELGIEIPGKQFDLNEEVTQTDSQNSTIRLAPQDASQPARFYKMGELQSAQEEPLILPEIAYPKPAVGASIDGQPQTNIPSPSFGRTPSWKLAAWLLFTVVAMGAVLILVLVKHA